MTLKLQITQRAVCWIICIFISAMLIANMQYICIDNSIVGTDSPNHLFASLNFYYQSIDIFTNTTDSFLQKTIAIYQLISRPGSYGGVYWPNGLNATTTIFYYILQPSLFSAKLSLFPYLLILLAATFYIGKYYGTPLTGLIAAYVLYTYPIVFESSRQYQLDFPLTAMVTLTIALLLRTRHFKDRLYSCLAGCALGGAMLIKGQAIVFIIAPLMVIFTQTLHELREDIQKEPVLNSKTKNNIVLFFVFLLIFMSFWWFGKTGQLKQQLVEHIFISQKVSYEGYAYGAHNKFSPVILLFYLRAAIWAMGPLASAAFLLFAFLSKEKMHSKPICFSWVIIPFVIFSAVFSIKSPRFLMPILPAIALITSWTIDRLKKNTFLAIFGILLVGALQFYGFSYAGCGGLPIVEKTYKYFPASGYTVKPQTRKHNISAVAEVLRELRNGKHSLKVGTICTGNLDTFEVLYWLLLYDKNLDIVDLVQAPKRFAAEFDSLDVILFSKHPQYRYSKEWPHGQALRELLLRRFTARTEIQNQNNSSLWTQLMTKLTQAEQKFTLFAEVRDEETGYNIYQVYKKSKQMK